MCGVCKLISEVEAGFGWNTGQMLHYKESIEPSGNYTVLCEKK
jgi:hypothetical protein